VKKEGGTRKSGKTFQTLEGMVKRFKELNYNPWHCSSRVDPVTVSKDPLLLVHQVVSIIRIIILVNYNNLSLLNKMQ